MDAEAAERGREPAAAGAQFVYFRQGKPKSSIRQSQEKTAKRKSSSVHTHDIPKEAYALAAQGLHTDIEGKTEDTNLLENKIEDANLLGTATETERSAVLSGCDVPNDHVAEKVTINHAAEHSELDAKICQVRITELEDGLLEEQGAAERLTVQMTKLQELTQHSDSMQLQETTIQEQYEVIKNLASCLPQTKKDRDDLQDEASSATIQIHDLQLYLHQNTEDNLIAQVEEDMKDTVQQLYKSIQEKEQHIRRLQDLLTSERFSLSILQHTLSLRDSAITELKNEIAFSKMKEQQHIEELKISHEKDICRQLENLRAELEKCHRREIEDARQVYEEEVILKYKNELEQFKKELSALNSEEYIQNLNGIIIDLNNSLRESEINRENLRKKLENQREDFQKEKSEIEAKYKDLIDSFKSQLSDAEEQIKEAQRYKQEKQSLNEEIQKLNSFIQELNEKRLYDTENSIDLRQRHDEEIVSNKKVMKLRGNQNLSEVSQLQKPELEETWNKHHQLKGEDELCYEKLKFQRDFVVASSMDQLGGNKNSKVTGNNDSSEGENISEEHLSELEPFSSGEGILAKYLISTERPEELYVSSESEGYAIEESRCSRYGLDSSVLLELSRDFITPVLNLSLDEEACPSDLAQEAFEETGVGAEAFVSYLSDNSLQQIKVSGQGDVKDGETVCLVKSVELTEQICEKESALKKSYQETQEAVGKWEEVMDDLSHIHGKELEKECEARSHCKKKLLQNMEKENELENKINQQDEDGGQPYCTVGPLTQVSMFCAWQELVKDLQEEREMLMVQLRTQEQLVKDVQEQKTASDSVTSEVQSLFGHQLAALQNQRDQMQRQLDTQKAKNQTIAELLGQKTVCEETLLKEQEFLKAEINNKEQNLALLLKEKTALEERLSDMGKNLIKAEEALVENACIIEDLEKNIFELNTEVKNLKEIHECERLGYEDRLNFSNLEINKLNAELKAKSTEYNNNKKQLTEEIALLKKVCLDLENRLQESLQSVQAAQEAQSEIVKHYKEEMDNMETQHLAELNRVSLTHKKEIEELNAEIKDEVEKQQKLEEERKEQIVLIKKVHEREHDREISELIAKHEEEMEKLHAKLKEQQHQRDELQQQMAAMHKAEIEQAQLQSQKLHNLELEALRLSLNNMHTSQLELTQSNLRKEKETALMELREMLNDKRAQEVAILQSRHQLEWEKIKEQCLKEKEDLKLKYQQELVDQRKKIELEMEETHIQALETLKKDWESESEMRLKSMCEKLSENHQTEMAELQKTLETELEKVKMELELLLVENEQSKTKCVELEKQHQLAITELQEQLQSEHNQLLEDMNMKSQKKEKDLQKELEKLQVIHEELKTQSQEEIRQLWSHLDTTRANRQELSDGETIMQARGPELKEQLLARATQVEEVERLKLEFEQQCQQTKSEHENELEQLRLYFEKKLKVAEENYREELTFLHQRLQELKEHSLSELEVSQDQAGDISSSVAVFENTAGRERRDRLGQLNQLLEQHQEELACLQVQLKEQHRHELDSLKFSLGLQYKENLMKMKMDLSDKYRAEIEEMKRQHCLELEQLRAQLSEEHIKEITKLHLQSAQDAARQVEMEVAERVSVLEEEHKARLSLLHSEKQYIAELLEEIKRLKEEITKQKDFSVQNEKHLKEEMEKEKDKIAEEHKNKLREAREEIQKIETIYKKKEMEWKCQSEDQRTQAEEKLSSLSAELENRVEYEKQNLRKEFELREAEMHQLQDHQATKILELEKLVKEQQNNLQQLEDSLASIQATWKSPEQYDCDLQAAEALMAKEMENAILRLQEESALKLMEAQNRFMEEHKDITQKFTTEQEILLQELKKKHVNELELQSQQLEEKHKQQILCLTAEFQAKHQAEIEMLKSTLESKQQSHLEAHIAELQAKHQTEVDKLEAKHLSNLDSLESSYLSEIQNIRDEHSQALEKLQLQHTEQLHEKDKMHQAHLAQETEMLKLKHAEELELSQNNLKIELATAHKERLRAMALEAEAAHKDDLNTALQNQRILLEEEKHLALDILREEVVHMEEKHRKALQELQCLHEAEIKKHKEEYSRDLEKELGKLKAQHEHEQEMYVSASASEVESVRTALLAQFEDIKLKQQLHFQEEVELLKCQSEVLLEQQIAQLKDEFEYEKKVSLHDKEQMLIQAQQKEQMLSAQLQEKAAIITQLENKVESLNCEIEETNSQLETLVQQRDRENQEEGNLVAMLRSDIEESRNEREKMQESYQHLLKLLMELVKATIAIEDLISSKIGLCLNDSLASGDSRESQSIMEDTGLIQYFKAKEKHHLEKVDELLDETFTEHNQLSPVIDEGSDLSQHLCESVFAKPELACENEEMILKIGHRLRTAVERLLEVVTESTKQLEKMHENHVQFEEEFNRQNRETAQVVSQHQELMECLSEESEAKNQLALELHKAEGIIEGYVAEKAALEEALNLKEESERRLVVELENMRERFQELTQEQAILGLLKEVEFLAKEKLELQCQAEKDHSNLRCQMKVLEVELEEQLHSNQDLAAQLLEVAELKQQIQVLEKQLKNQRQFMDEQAMEREHERDDFQQEIQKLEEQLKLAAKSQISGEPKEYRNYELILQVESLQAEMKEKMDDYNKLLLEKEQKAQEITARDKEIEKLVARILELEHSSTELSKTVRCLEQQLQKLKKVETELKQDKEALQQQQYNNLIQISALQSKLDEARHRVPADGSSAPVLKEQLQAEQEALQTKEREIAILLDQLEQYKDNLTSKNEAILQLNLQLEMEKNLSSSSISQLRLQNAHLKENLSKLQVKQNQDLGITDSSALSFPQALLKEKNQEIDDLNEQMKRLQHELKNTLEKKIVEDQKSEIEELRTLVEHLRSDQERLRKDKDEEVEQLHGVIEKLQKELAQFGPVCHEISENQDDLYHLALGKPVENLQNELKSGLVDCQGDIDPTRRNELLLSKVRELQEELELVSTARDALQQHLEEKELQFKKEVEILEKKCQKLQESSEQQIAELTSLRIHDNALQEKYSLYKTQLSQRDIEARVTTSHIQELEDAVREREANILEKDMQIKAMAEQREAHATQLQYLTKKATELQTKLEKRDTSHAQDVYNLQLKFSRLQLQVQTLNQKEVAYQREINELQGSTANLEDQIKIYVKELEALRLERAQLISQLELYKPKEQCDHEETNLLKPCCQRERKCEALKRGMEEMKELEANVDQSFAVLTSPTSKLKKDEVMFELTAHDINPKTQIAQSQENNLTQDLDGINNSEEEQNLKKHYQQMLKIHQTPNSPRHNLNIDKDTSKDLQNFIAGIASWASPEILRKQDMRMELQPVLHLTPFSEVESADFEIMHTRSSAQEENSVFLGCSNLYENVSEEAAVRVESKSPTFSESTYSDDQDMEKKVLMREADNLTLTPSDLQDDARMKASAIDAMSDGYDSNTSSNLAVKLMQELQMSDHLDASFMAYLQYHGILPDAMESVREQEILSPQLKAVLKMVYEESWKILALSGHPFGFRELKNVHQSRVAIEGWQKECFALLDAIQSLKDYFSKVADRGDKEHSDIAADWRGELLQAVQSVLEKERNVLQIDLNSHFSNPGSGDEGSLVEKLEYIMKQQEEQRQMVVEHLFSSDRNSLLSEIQDLRAQLRMTHLQNQEKLQQLQETLTNVEDHGSKQEHHLRRKVELLEYKLQQEKSVISDLHSTLSEEQKRASETHDLLNQQKVALKSELYESKQENERLQKSLEELQKEVKQLRFALEKKEEDLRAALEDLQTERLKEMELQALYEEQQLEHKKAEDEKTKALEELQAALELQSVQNSQLAVSIEYEKAVNDNLRKELQIEHSRCEALLSQEQAKLLELQRNLDNEKSHSLELLNSLNHERVLTEQLSMRLKEGVSCQHRESLLEQAFVRELQAQLEEERSRTVELAAVIEKMHQKAIHSKRQLEAEVQMHCEETQKEREVSDKLRATLECLQGQKRGVIHSLEAQNEREAKLEADWEELKLIFNMKDQDKNKKEEREQRQQQQTDLEKHKDWQRDHEKMENLEQQHHRDEQRIKELQEMLATLQEREISLRCPNCQQELLGTLNKDLNAKQTMTKETEKSHLQQQQQQLEKIRQRLLFVVVHLNEFIYKTVDKTVNDWAVSNGEAIASLLQTLKELKSDLLSPPVSQMRSMDDTDSVQELERNAWQRERNILQNALQQAETKLAKATVEIENKPVVETSSPKLQRLYRKYLRAESFRKALVYQKKYLLLLLGGFQDCEQATLSLIARMGIYPSHADLQLSGSHSRPFTKFRCTVRVIIAVSRLKFLVKKWNKVGRKSAQTETTSHNMGGNTACAARTEILKEHQLPAVHLSSSPTRDTGLCHRTNSPRLVSQSPSSSHRSHHRVHPSTSSSSEKSLVPTQDPERSLTEYIHRLEIIQQRLGGVQPGQVPGPPWQKNMKK